MFTIVMDARALSFGSRDEPGLARLNIVGMDKDQKDVPTLARTSDHIWHPSSNGSVFGKLLSP